MISPRTLRNLRKELRNSYLAKLGIVIVVVVVLVAIFAPLLAPHDPTEQHLDKSQLPPLGFSKTVEKTTSKMVNGSLTTVTETVSIDATAKYPLGTDPLGRDLLSRVIYGARTSLLVGILGTLLAAFVGVTVGLIAGYFGGRVDDVLMRGADIMLAFPSLVLAVALVGLAGERGRELLNVQVPDPIVWAGENVPFFPQLAPEMPETFVIPGIVVVVVGLVNWVWFARVSRGEALTVSKEEYVKAAKALGASHGRIIRTHVFPNSVTPILVLATIQVAAIILLESALSFLGFSGTTLSWGFDIAQGRDYLSTSWWIATMPGIAIVITVVGINLVGDWLRDALDPGIEGEGGGV